MARYVAFLRGINVGGHIVKMDDLRKVFEASGFANVKTFIASGNVLFDTSSRNTAAVEKKISSVLRKELGYEVATFVRSADEVTAIAEHEPYPASDLKEGSLFVGLFAETVEPRDKKIVAGLESPVDSLRVHKREVYWHARQNFSDSLFAPAKMEKLLGKQATFRNINTIRRIAALFAKLCLFVALTAPLGANTAEQRASDSEFKLPERISVRLSLLSGWIEAVLEHAPGESDDAVEMIRAWTPADVRDAWANIGVFMSLLNDHDQTRIFVRHFGQSVPMVLSREDRVALLERVVAIEQRPGTAPFLKRAAILHTDAAVVPTPDNRTQFMISFLMPQRVFVETDDGTQTGANGGDVNWEFARVLLGAVPNARLDTDVRDWYRATLAHLIGDEHLDAPFFAEALRLFPNDAEMLLLAGCLHEVYAEPRVQVVMNGLDAKRRFEFDIGSEVSELELAESRFRRALAADPSHSEAQLRRGRALGKLGRHKEGASELRMARERVEEPLLKYFAALFAGAEEEALGRFDESKQAYEDARALFPRAQAPLLGLSELAHRRGDRVGARQALTQSLRIDSRKDEDDPWWGYRKTCGRHAEQRLTDVYRAIVPGARR